MTKVADEVLGKLARQQADLFRRVREGSLDPETVSRRLQEIIQNDFLTIDYGQTLAEMIVAGHYDWTNSDITAERFPISGNGMEEYEYKLYHFDWNISPDEVVKRMTADGWQAAPIECLLAYGVKYPDSQRQFPIIALGSVVHLRGACRVAFLGTEDSRRKLDLLFLARGLFLGSRFLAIRKRVPTK